MNKATLYIHGKGGNAAECEFYRPLVTGDIFGLDYDDYSPGNASALVLRKYRELILRYDSVDLIANSIGAWFAMLSLSYERIGRATFISPVVDMERLILEMMLWADISEDELRVKGEIPTNFGETLSWDYLCFVRNHPVEWRHPTTIFYGENDHLIAHDTITAFADKTHARLFVCPKGEHWFHTPEQMKFIKNHFE